jgi:hippurate hydrolase
MEEQRAAGCAEWQISYAQQYPTLINSQAAARSVEVAGSSVFNRVETNPPQTMIIEDFAFMLGRGRSFGLHERLGGAGDLGYRVLSPGLLLQ